MRSFEPRLAKYYQRERERGYETKRENRGTGCGRLHFALASRRADSGFASVFSAARLHIGAGGTQGRGLAWRKSAQRPHFPPGKFLPAGSRRLLLRRAKSFREASDGFR